jgi:hypothetical protein
MHSWAFDHGLTRNVNLHCRFPYLAATCEQQSKLPISLCFRRCSQSCAVVLLHRTRRGRTLGDSKHVALFDANRNVFDILQIIQRIRVEG